MTVSIRTFTKGTVIRLNTKTKIAVIGGDKRFELLTDKFKTDGYDVTGVFHENADADFFGAVTDCEILILPLPAVSNGSHINVSEPYLKHTGADISQIPTLYELLLKLHKNQLILGGLLPQWFMDKCQSAGLQAIDYYTSERLEILTVLPTVEGCIGILISELKKTISGCNILITGYGKIGKTLAKYLKFFGATVSAAARKDSDLAWMEVHGILPVKYDGLPLAIKNMDAVVNTVPAVILSKEILTASKPDCLFIDLASKPGGIEFAAAAQLGRKTIWALSLPGKIAPISAAGYLYQTILNFLENTYEVRK